MLDRLIKLLAKPGEPLRPGDSAPSRDADGPMSQWAATRGLVVAPDHGGALAFQGRVCGRKWRLERGRPTRDYIAGEELRARAQLQLDEEVAAMVMNRPLGETLQRKAYERSVADLRTTLETDLPHEVRWLAMYDETVWASLPQAFWRRYSVHTDRPDLAASWLGGALAELLLRWPEPRPSDQVPFMLLLMRGKAYLRMEYRPADLPTLQHAVSIFTTACESALTASLDLALD